MAGDPPGGSLYGALVWLVTTAISIVVVAWLVVKLTAIL